MERVKAVTDDDGHRYIIPYETIDEFYSDQENEDMVDSGSFDNKWGKYRTGGDLNIAQLWAEIK